MKFEGLIPLTSVGVQSSTMTCLICRNKSLSKHRIMIYPMSKMVYSKIM